LEAQVGGGDGSEDSGGLLDSEELETLRLKAGRCDADVGRDANGGFNLGWPEKGVEVEVAKDVLRCLVTEETIT
jgi:hypothetical protein